MTKASRPARRRFEFVLLPLALVAGALALTGLPGGAATAPANARGLLAGISVGVIEAPRFACAGPADQQPGPWATGKVRIRAVDGYRGTVWYLRAKIESFAEGLHFEVRADEDCTGKISANEPDDPTDDDTIECTFAVRAIGPCSAATPTVTVTLTAAALSFDYDDQAPPPTEDDLDKAETTVTVPCQPPRLLLSYLGAVDQPDQDPPDTPSTDVTVPEGGTRYLKFKAASLCLDTGGASTIEVKVRTQDAAGCGGITGVQRFGLGYGGEHEFTVPVTCFAGDCDFDVSVQLELGNLKSPLVELDIHCD